MAKPLGVYAPKPHVLVVSGVPELFCDVVVVEPHGETVRMMLARELSRGGTQYELTGLVFMPMSGFIRSHAWATELLPRSH